MSDPIKSRIVNEIAGSIDIPDSSYEKAEARYKDLAEWFCRKDGRCKLLNPDIYPQGSFRLGTVIRPLDAQGEYDLDVGCRLRSGVTKATHTQQQLKLLVGAELEDYRIARGIKERLEEKHRCWRLEYADALRFHLDTVPSIPETQERVMLVRDSIVRAGVPVDLAIQVANLTGAITDDRLWNYKIIQDDWRLSNSEGFARWFGFRMKLAKALMDRRALDARMGKIDDLPAYRWKSPLQRCVQLLKRHRDLMFVDDPDGKPASIIITTLSGRAYQGEVDIADALDTILSSMASLVNVSTPRVPNPVNPAEDFADRWTHKDAQRHNLEANFWRWLRQAQTDFEAIGKQRSLNLIVETARDKFGTSLDPKDLGRRISLSAQEGLLKAAVVPGGLSFPDKPLMPNKPAGFA
jgi:hypothetical protein